MSSFLILHLHPPFRSVCHRCHIQRSSGEVVTVRPGLTVKACAETLSDWRPVQDPNVLRQDAVQHLHIRDLRDIGFILGAGVHIFRQGDAQSSAKLCGAQIDGDDLWRRGGSFTSPGDQAYYHHIFISLI